MDATAAFRCFLPISTSGHSDQFPDEILPKVEHTSSQIRPEYEHTSCNIGFIFHICAIFLHILYTETSHIYSTWRWWKKIELIFIFNEAIQWWFTAVDDCRMEVW